MGLDLSDLHALLRRMQQITVNRHPEPSDVYSASSDIVDCFVQAVALTQACRKKPKVPNLRVRVF